MNKRLMLVAGLVLVLIVVVISILVMKQEPTKALPTTFAQAKAMRSNNSPACRTDNTKQFKLSSSAQQSIELAVISQLVDVPAGTNVDVHLNTYSPTKITGSDIYAADYGSYNFTAAKSSETADWHVTEFTACK